MNAIEFVGVHKWFGSFHVLRNIDLEVRPGERIVVCGPSGSGKSTLIRCVNRLEEHQRGTIRVDGIELTADVKRIDEVRREVGMVFQQFNLFPHLTILENCTLAPIWVRKMPKREAEEVAMKFLTRVKIPEQAHKYPGQLSGGQQQRVALARSLVKRPKLLLLDEPMSALDKKIRQKTQLELVNIIEKVDVTCVMVTHDQEEAMTMAGRLAVMSEGRIVQIGTPSQVYEFPNSRFSAEFIGTTNMFEGVVVEDEPDHIFVESEDLETRMYVSHGITGPLGMPVGISVRPERVKVSLEKPGTPHNWARGVVSDVAYMGSYSLYHVRLPSGKTVVSNLSSSHLMSEGAPAYNDDVFVHWSPASGVVVTQ
jgi:putrescine transport system ATP-binding protein